MNIAATLSQARKHSNKLLAILLDPQGLERDKLNRLVVSCRKAHVDFIFIGGSLVYEPVPDWFILDIKEICDIPCVLFPAQLGQLNPLADGILLLSLISGRNPEYLIGKHVEAAPILKKSGMQIIPTGYILIDGGQNGSVHYVTQTLPIPSGKSELAVATAMAGEQLGLKAIYLEAGSGARRPVDPNLIQRVKTNTEVPILVGGGIKSPEQAYQAAVAGADLVVIGNAIQDEEADIFDFSVAVHSVRNSIKG